MHFSVSWAVHSFSPICPSPLSPQTQSPGGPRLCPVCESTAPRTRRHIVGLTGHTKGPAVEGQGSGACGEALRVLRMPPAAAPRPQLPWTRQAALWVLLGFPSS